MEILHHILASIMHLDQQLIGLVTAYGAWTYLILFLIVFLETAMVIAFIPGDSLLVASGTLAASATGILNIHIVFITLVSASVMGNGINYFFGKWIGPKIFNSETSRFFNKKHIENTRGYFDRYGGKTVIIARFVPIVRIIAPFVAGIGYMTYRKFFIYNLIGCLIWLGLLLYGSYQFGSLEIVKQHFSLVIAAVIFISVSPVLIELLRRKYFFNLRNP